MEPQKPGIISLAVTNCAFRDHIDWIEIPLSRKRCAIHLFCNYKKGSAGRILRPLPLPVTKILQSFLSYLNFVNKKLNRIFVKKELITKNYSRIIMYFVDMFFGAFKKPSFSFKQHKMGLRKIQPLFLPHGETLNL